MDFVVNFIGFVNSLWIVRNKSNRKYFCVCDKITIGDYTPQCMYGAFSHLLSLMLILLSLEGYSFYPLSLWLFALVYSGIYTYKSVREICRGCAVAFTTALFAVVISFNQLGYFPWAVCFTYFILITLSLCLTSLAINKNN